MTTTATLNETARVEILAHKAAKVLNARFAGLCLTCGTRFPANAEIIWSPRGTCHYECPNTIPARVPASVQPAAAPAVTIADVMDLYTDPSETVAVATVEAVPAAIQPTARLAWDGWYNLIDASLRRLETVEIAHTNVLGWSLAADQALSLRDDATKLAEIAIGDCEPTRAALLVSLANDSVTVTRGALRRATEAAETATNEVIDELFEDIEESIARCAHAVDDAPNAGTVGIVLDQLLTVREHAVDACVYPGAFPALVDRAELLYRHGLDVLRTIGDVVVVNIAVGYYQTQDDNRYRVTADPDTNTRFVEVRETGGWRVVAYLDNTTCAVRRWGRSTTNADKARIAWIEANQRAAGQAYARETGKCYRCNRHLTDEISVRNSLGPVCADVLGITRI